MKSIEIARQPFLTLSIGSILVLLAFVTLFFFYKKMKIEFHFKYFFTGCFISLLTWPISLISYKGYPEHPDFYWKYYGFPIPIHMSHDHFGTSSISRHPIFIGIYINIIFYTVLYTYLKKKKTEQGS